MTPNEYQKAALRTESTLQVEDGEDHTLLRLLHGILGMSGETGECADLVKKHIYQGHDLDPEHVAKELGDVCWYIAVAADALGYDFETILEMNIDKLKARYKDGFTVQESLHRDENDI